MTWGHGWWLKPYRVPSEPERKKRKKKSTTALFFSKNKNKKNKAIKNKNPKIIRLSEPGDVYFIGFDLLVEMAEAPRHLLIKN